MAKSITRTNLKKQDFLVLRRSRDEIVTNVIAPNGLQVGLTDDKFNSALTVKGALVVEKGIQVADGTGYLKAGSNISLSTASDGSVTVSTSTATGTVTNALTVGDGLQLSSGTTFDGSAALTVSADLKSGGALAISSGELTVDINSTATTAGIATDDEVLIYDTSATALKKVTVANLRGSGLPLDISGLSNSLNDSSLASGDLLAIADVDDSNEVKKLTVEDLGQYLASSTNSGVGESSGKLTIDLNDLTAAVVDVGNDSVAIIDSNASNATRKESIADLVGAFAGTSSTTGLAANSGVLSIDITNQSSAGTLAGSEEILVWNGSAMRKTTPAAIANLTVDINAAGSATVNVAADSIGFIDADDGNATKKDTIADLIAAIAGNGLAATSGVLSVDLNEATAGTVSVASDSITFIDASDSNTIKKESISDLVSSIASTGLSVSSGQISVSYGTTSTTAARGNNTITVVAGDGLKSGGSVTIGSNNSSVQVDINPTDFAGTGLIASGDDMHAYLEAGANITITTGSEGQLVIAGNAADIEGVTAGLGLSGGGSTGSPTINLDVSELTALGQAPDNSDFFVIQDSTDNSTKKVLFSNFRNNNQFSGAVGITGSLEVTNGISGSLTHLRDGSSYMIAGTNVSIVTGSSGAITISSTDTNDQYTAGQGLELDSNNEFRVDVEDNSGIIYRSGDLALDNSVVAMLSGSVFSGAVGVTGSLHVTSEISGSILRAPILSGSLTQLEDGTSYLIAGSNVVITTGSSGAITIAATAADGGEVGSITGVTAGTGLSGGGNSGAVTLNLDYAGADSFILAATDGTGITVDGSNDKLVIYDNDAGTVKYVNANQVGRTYTAGSGLDVSAGGEFSLDLKAISGLVIDSTELSIDDSKIAMLSGSVFSGHVGVTGSIHATAEMSASIVKSPVFSGSLTHLEDGSSYLIAGNNITIATGSSGAITITGTSTGDITSVVAGTGLTGGGASGDVTLNIDNSVVATLSGSVFSGHVGVTGSVHTTAEMSASIFRGPVLSGSLTRLEDGSSYLIAGSNITITSASNGSVTIATDASGTGNIGDPEDGTYGDGLFSDFTSSTSIGIAVDRFNEVLKALAPDPAPDLDDVDCNTSDGITAFLSFGAANDQSSASPAYASSATAAGFSAIDVNGSYAPATSGNNIKKGIYNGAQAITGDLNEDVAQGNNGAEVNFVANSFGNAETGTLKLEVNGSVVHSVNLALASAGSGVPGSGTASQLNGNSSGFTNLSQTGSATLSNGDPFPSFQHRTGRYQVGTGDQRNGWNYARVIHTIGSTDKTTNYVEWVNDPDSNNISAAGNQVTDVALTGEVAISGVRYATDATANYKVRVSNAYKYIYNTSNITFTTSNCTIAAQSKPTINTGAGETHTKVLHLTGAMDISLSGIFGGTASASVNVTHPFSSKNLSSGGSASATGFLIYNVSNNSTDLFESFRMENKRLLSGSYNAMSDITGGSYDWDNTLHLSGSAAQADGLIFYNDRLYSAINTLNSGDFRNTADGGPLANGYVSNPNYSGLNSGTKTFFRSFRNTTGNAVRDFDITINGSGTTIVPMTTALNSGRIRVLGKIPGTTGWMDLAAPFTFNSSSFGDGAYIGNFDSSVNAVNAFSFGTTEVANNDYVMLAIEADASWSGYLSDITVNFPAVGVNAVAAAPVLGNIDCNDTGVAAKLSFGASKAISGYTNSNTSAGFSAVDINGAYTVSSNSSNLRRAVFAGATVIDGELNETTTGNGNAYPHNGFRDGHTGSLKLEINGTVEHTLNIHDLGVLGVSSTTSFNGDGSGFQNITQALNGKDSSALPDFRRWYRTASYKITAASQRPGWNYARVIHSIPGESDRETNYVEWVNDPNAEALFTASGSYSIFGSSETYYQSGVRYMVSPTGSLAFQANNVYKNVYSNSSTAVTIGGLSNFSVSEVAINGNGISNSTDSGASGPLPNLDPSVSEPHTLPIHLTASLSFTRSTSLPASSIAGGTSYNATANATILHPLKSSGTLTTQTKSNFLVFSGSNSSDVNTTEHFVQERYRVRSGSYTTQNSSVATMWDSSVSMNDQANHPSYATGLLIYNSCLISPKKGPNSGNFKNYAQGGSLTSAHNNPDYSSLTNDTRWYMRHFLNNTTNDTPQVTISIRGDATLVAGSGPNYSALGANKNCRVEVKIPGKTGWMDTARSSAGSGNISDGDGALSGDLDPTIDGSGNSNICSFNGQTVDGTVSGAEYIIVSVIADEDWTGHITRITVSYS